MTRLMSRNRFQRFRPEVRMLEDRTVPAAVASPGGLVSWWTGDNTPVDLIGGNDASLYNGTDYDTGYVAGGFNFDGNDDILEAPTAGLPIGSADRTIELWARIDQTSGQGHATFAAYGAPGLLPQEFELVRSNAGRFFVSQWGLNIGLDGPVQNGRWYHVAASNVGQSFTLYLDGAQVATGDMPINTPADSTFWMGRLTMTSIGDTRRLDGMVDEVTVYDRALSPLEIQAIYSAGSDGKIKSPDYVAADFASVTEGQVGSSAIATFTLTRVGNLRGEVTVGWSTADRTATAGTDYVAASGSVTFLDGESQKTVQVFVTGDNVLEANETFDLLLTTTTPEYALGMGQATVIDDDATKFFVVDDAGSNATYEYNASGNAIENYALAPANAAPRGAASTSAGDKVWVIDANKNVYVYNPSGGLLGSWTAGSLNAQAQVEGVATNGTDVWIVDAKQDKVFKYAGAASRLSGSQNAASNFSLNSGNKDPKDIVTDGSSLWVVNGSTTGKVFKYSLTGTLLGSWTISTSGASSPTGITLDPTNVNHLWIVDSGTDRVYQYDGATSRTSGSQAASTSFALAAGNTNPQGIADPPVARTTTGRLPKVKAPKADSAAIDALFAMDALGRKRARKLLV